jgi:hypothetical protein
MELKEEGGIYVYRNKKGEKYDIEEIKRKE